MFFFFFNFNEVPDAELERTGNKGEWSEVYTMFKLLGEGKLYSGDENYNKIDGKCYPILSIIREELLNQQKQRFEYKVIHKNNDLNDSAEGIVIQKGKEEVLRMRADSFLEAANHLLGILKESTGRSFATSVKNEAFMKKVHCHNIKRDSGHKTDIDICLYDTITKIENVLGMSIKSLIGGAPTLLNTSDATLITYRITGAEISDDDIERINSINDGAKLKKRIAAIRELGADIEFKDYDSEVFKGNLDLIDSGLPVILATAVLRYYSVSRKSSMESIVDEIATVNPLSSNQRDLNLYYGKKMTRLLEASALGMYPATPYDDSTDAKGYIIVRNDGEIVCYHFYDRDMVRKHLFDNTKFDTPQSSKSGRKPFCQLYRTENGDLEIKLNFQIRWND